MPASTPPGVVYNFVVFKSRSPDRRKKNYYSPNYGSKDKFFALCRTAPYFS